MSSIPYSGGTIYDAQFTCTTGTRREVVDGLVAGLGAAGWTTVSGAGTGDVLMSSAATADGNSIRMRIWDPGSASTARVTMKNAAGTITGQEYFLLTGAGAVYRVIACKYNFFIFTAASAAREVLFGGTLSIPSFLSGVVTGDLGWIQGNATSDTDVSASRETFRHALVIAFNPSRAEVLVTGTLTVLNVGGLGSMQLACRWGSMWGGSGHTAGYRWFDNTVRSIEAELIAGHTLVSNEGKSIGFLHNCMLVGDAYPADDRTVTSYDGHAWHAISNNLTGANGSRPRGCLFVAIT